VYKESQGRRGVWEGPLRGFKFKHDISGEQGSHD
jgi:hypothetical protein